MNKLLRANFSRLWKDNVFGVVTLFMFGLGIFTVGAQYFDIMRYNANIPFNNALFSYAAVIGCGSAIFSSLFFGTEYSDGTIRNKLIVGHLRSSIYLSNWLMNMAATVIMTMAFLASYCLLGALLLDAPTASPGAVFSLICISIFTASAYVSIFTMLSMLIAKKSTAAVLCLLVFIGLLIAALVIKGKLDAPEFLSEYSMSVNGIEQLDPTPNPKYLQPLARKVYQFFFDVLPTGQSIQLSAFAVVHPSLMVLCSAGISLTATVSGVFAFRKKNLK